MGLRPRFLGEHLCERRSPLNLNSETAEFVEPVFYCIDALLEAVETLNDQVMARPEDRGDLLYDMICDGFDENVVSGIIHPGTSPNTQDPQATCVTCGAPRQQ